MTLSRLQNDFWCPRWCSGVHEIDDHLRVVHRSDSVTVPAVERQHLRDHPQDGATSLDLVVGLERVDGETWVWISPSEDVRRALVLSHESARRLSRALSTLVIDRYPSA